MIKFILSKFFNKTTQQKEMPLTIINAKRQSVIVKQRVIFEKKERQTTCLSKYFEDIKGLNTVERNLYCQIKF